MSPKDIDEIAEALWEEANLTGTAWAAVTHDEIREAYREKAALVKTWLVAVEADAEKWRAREEVQVGNNPRCLVIDPNTQRCDFQDRSTRHLLSIAEVSIPAAKRINAVGQAHLVRGMTVRVLGPCLNNAVLVQVLSKDGEGYGYAVIASKGLGSAQ